MLVLSRRVGEQIVIGDDIVITVVDTRNDTVRLGITAPRSVRVDRAELLRAVAETNQESARADESALAALRALNRAARPARERPADAGDDAAPAAEPPAAEPPAAEPPAAGPPAAGPPARPPEPDA